MINDYLSLSTRAGFNKSLAHFRMVTDIMRRMNQGENLAEIIDALEKEKDVEKSQIGPILNAVVIDRMEYATRSFNLPADVQEFESLCSELQTWNRLDLVLAYHHPQLGISLINPKQPAHWETVRELAGDELLVLYAKAYDDGDRALEGEALSALHNLLTGRKAGDTAKFGGGAAKPAAAPKPPPAATPQRGGATPVAPPPPPPAQTTPTAPPPISPPPSAASEPEEAAPAPAPAPSPGGKVRMTPKYSVQVSNELFHNGNVEAWKNIVESYKTKYPGLEVHIFHDGQKVNNINALFKWGKVKHGDVIVFCVSGEDIKGVAKLQRYLYEGASIRFENFLKKDVNKVLNLF